MDTGRVKLTVEGAVAHIVFSNPDEGVMDQAMERSLVDVVKQVDADPALHVCVLSGGSPGTFIRHYDLKVLAPQAVSMAARDMRFSMERPVREGPIHVALRMIEQSDTVFIAALNGSAMGGGFELALACDLRIVEAGAYEFGLPEINLGILPGAGGTQRLPQLVGQARALQMTLTGDTLSPEQMVTFGLAMEVVEDAQAAGLALARRMAGKPPRAAAHIKSLVRGAHEASDLGHARERTMFADLMVQPEAGRLLVEGAQGMRRITDAP